MRNEENSAPRGGTQEIRLVDARQFRGTLSRDVL